MCLPRERACVILVSYGDCTLWWPVTFTLLTRDSLPLCVHFSWPKPDLVTSCLYDFTPFVYLYLFSFVIPRQNDKHFSNHSKTHLYRRGHLFAVFYWIRLLRVGKNSWTKTKQQVINGWVAMTANLKANLHNLNRALRKALSQMLITLSNTRKVPLASPEKFSRGAD